MATSTPLTDAVRALAELPDVPAAVDEAREACTTLRWHQALRRRIPEAAAESRVRGATASALLEGVEPAGSRGTVHLVRDLVRGATPWEGEGDPLLRHLTAVVRATAATEQAGPDQLRSPAQLLAALHTAAGAGILPSDEVGRPRRSDACPEAVEALGAAPDALAAHRRLEDVHALLAQVPQGGLPVLVVAAVAHAEIAVARPFAGVNGVVARAVERVVLRAGGLDPTGVAVPEVGHADRAGTDYRGALAAYASGEAEGVRLWLLHCAEAVVRAAAEGTRIADAVLAGRLGVDGPAGSRSG